MNHNANRSLSNAAAFVVFVAIIAAYILGSISIWAYYNYPDKSGLLECWIAC